MKKHIDKNSAQELHEYHLQTDNKKTTPENLVQVASKTKNQIAEIMTPHYVNELSEIFQEAGINFTKDIMKATLKDYAARFYGISMDGLHLTPQKTQPNSRIEHLKKFNIDYSNTDVAGIIHQAIWELLEQGEKFPLSSRLFTYRTTFYPANFKKYEHLVVKDANYYKEHYSSEGFIATKSPYEFTYSASGFEKGSNAGANGHNSTITINDIIPPIVSKDSYLSGGQRFYNAYYNIKEGDTISIKRVGNKAKSPYSSEDYIDNEIYKVLRFPEVPGLWLKKISVNSEN